MRVLVIGGSAFNGRSLVPVLVREGHDVTVCNRGRTPIEHPAGVELIAADRTDHDALRSALGGTEWDCVIDMTAYHPEDVEVMVDLFAGSTGHYIFVSSTVIYAAASPEHPGPITEQHPVEREGAQFEYGLDKILCEDLLLAAHADQGFPATIVALGMSFGPHNAIVNREQRMFARMLTGRPILMPGDGSTQTVVGYVDDQSEAFASLMGVDASFGRRFNLTGDDPHSDERYVRAFAEVTGAQPDVINVPAELMDQLWDNEIQLTPPKGSRSSMDIRPTDAAFAKVAPHLHKLPVSSLTQRLQPSIHRWDSDSRFAVDSLKEVSGWAPKHTFEQAVADAYDWWRGTDLLDTVEQDWTFEDEILALIRR